MALRFRFPRKLLPRSLFGRALLILVLPVLLAQIVTAYIFFERHWASVTRHFAATLAGEVAWLVDNWENAPDDGARQALLEQTIRYMGFAVQVEPSLRLEDWHSEPIRFSLFERALRRRIAPRPFAMRYLPKQDLLQLLVLVEGGMLRIEVPKKRLDSSTTWIFTVWVTGASALLLLVAVLFLRNQIRPIVRLAEAAERFGKGQEAPGFQPSGAREVRQAARAFIDMRDRIRRQVESRTAMLAGISHDLRTPLTRMKLQLALLPSGSGIEELQQDVAEMEHMVEEYLAFARGERGEEAQTVSLPEFIEETLAPYLREGRKVTLDKAAIPDCDVTLKPQAIKRALRNLIDNALRYGSCCEVEVSATRRQLTIRVDDDGPGIPPEQRAAVFQAFRRLDESRNSATGGAGLGLTIVRDILHAHGGDVRLEDAPEGGLRAVVTLPL